MSTTICHWRIFCITENIFVDGYLPLGTPCNVCFNCNTDIVNRSTAELLGTISPLTTLISTQPSGQTAGNFRSFRKKIACAPATSPGIGTVTLDDTTFKYDINILSFHADISNANTGDMFEVVIMPKGPIGLLITDLSIGNTVITLPPTLVPYFPIGACPIFISASTGHKEECSEIISITGNQITLEHPIASNFLTGDYILFAIKKIQTYYLNVAFHYTIGNYLRASFFPSALLKAQIRYTNNSDQQKDFIVGIDYLY